METVWKEILLVSLLLAVRAVQSVDRPVRLSTECSCIAVKADIMEAVQELSAAVNGMNRTLKKYTKLQEFHQEELLRRENIGQSWRYPAYSCREVAERKPQSSSGYYWAQASRLSPPVQVYCELDKVLDNSRGWMRVANLDMTDPHQQCPPGLTFISSPRRVCGRGLSGGGCSSVTFQTLGFQYEKVCGRVIGYQYSYPDAFQRFHWPPPYTIDGPYVDGVSITYGNYPRKHVWTYAAGLEERENRDYRRTQCPCSVVPGIQPPSFVGSDYYCESGVYTTIWQQVLYTSDVLWDGQRCNGYEGPCCNPPNLPWFCKDLPEPTIDDLEVRVCADESSSNEDAPIELVELYIQ